MLILNAMSSVWCIFLLPPHCHMLQLHSDFTPLTCHCLTCRRLHSESQNTNSNMQPASCLRVSTATLLVTCSTVGGTPDQAHEGLALTPRSSVLWGATRGPPFFVFNLLLARRYAGYFTCCPELQQQRTYTLLAWLIWYPARQVFRIRVNIKVARWTRRGGEWKGYYERLPPPEPHLRALKSMTTELAEQ